LRSPPEQQQAAYGQAKQRDGRQHHQQVQQAQYRMSQPDNPRYEVVRGEYATPPESDRHFGQTAHSPPTRRTSLYEQQRSLKSQQHLRQQYSPPPVRRVETFPEPQSRQPSYYEQQRDIQSQQRQGQQNFHESRPMPRQISHHRTASNGDEIRFNQRQVPVNMAHFSSGSRSRPEPQKLPSQPSQPAILSAARPREDSAEAMLNKIIYACETIIKVAHAKKNVLSNVPHELSDVDFAQVYASAYDTYRVRVLLSLI
jgi:hypothetical protein